MKFDLFASSKRISLSSSLGISYRFSGVTKGPLLKQRRSRHTFSFPLRAPTLCCTLMLFKKLRKYFEPSLKPDEQEPDTSTLTAKEFATAVGLNVIECDQEDESYHDTIVSMSSGLTSVHSSSKSRKHSYNALDMNIFIPPAHLAPTLSIQTSQSANSALKPMTIPYKSTTTVPRIRTKSLSIEAGPHSASNHISPLLENSQQTGRFLTITYSNSYYTRQKRKNGTSRFETVSLDRETSGRRFSEAGIVDGSFRSSSL